MSAASRSGDSSHPWGETYLLVALSVGLGAVTWAVHLYWDQVIDTSQPDPLARGASVILGVLGLLWSLAHGIGLRACRRRRADRGIGRSGWGGTPPVVLMAVATVAAVLVLYAQINRLPAVVWLVPAGLLALEALVVLAFDERRADTG